MSEQSGRAFTDAKDAQAVAQLRELLNTVWRITLKADERVFLGKFMVVDRQVSTDCHAAQSIMASPLSVSQST